MLALRDALLPPCADSYTRRFLVFADLVRENDLCCVQESVLLIGGFPGLTAHSGTLNITVDLASFNGRYTHTPDDDTTDGFPIWRTGASGDHRFLYFQSGDHNCWVFNTARTPESGVHWAKAKELPAIQDIGPVPIGDDMAWEVFNGVGFTDVGLSVSCSDSQ